MTLSNTSAFMGIAAAATTDGHTPPRYGLSYDLATGQWQNAAQFQQFARDVLPVAQAQTTQAATQVAQSREHFLELQRAQLFDQHGVEFNVSPEEAIAYAHGNDLTKAGFITKKATSILTNSFKGLAGLASNLVHGDSGLPSHPYEEYTKRGGLLTEQEFNSFSDDTKMRLIGEARTHSELHDLSGAPIIKQTLEGIGAAYTGITASTDMLGQTVLSGKPQEYFSPNNWARAWREAQGHSLGNSLVNLALDPLYSREQLDRWKRDNPWYQMTSVGVEIGATWYVDPVAIAGKGLGAAARAKTLAFPINDASGSAIALRQAVRREPITTHNPATKAYAKVQANRIDGAWDQIKSAAQAMSPAEFADLPMFKSRYRAQDGGAAAYALHWAANNEGAINAAIKSSPDLTNAFDALGVDKAFTPHIDAWDLTRQMTMGDPKAYAMLEKLRTIPPEELQRVAPGAGSLIEAVDALKTKADVFQQEVDDLLKQASDAGVQVDAMGKPIVQPTAANETFPEWNHRWEIHTSLADKQQQLTATTEMLQKYEGYDNWLALAARRPELNRVSVPTRKRWSQIRNTPNDASTEQRSLFMDNPYGAAHSFTRLPKSLFMKRANTVEIHNLDSGLMSINRQFDQFEHLFGYAPEGAREAYLSRYVRAESAAQPEYERYAILHDLEEEHLVNGIAHRFNIDPEMARAITKKIDAERNKSIDGILSGSGTIYRSAPSTMDRLTGGDSSLQLVNVSEDGQTYTVNLMHGHHKQTFEVPAAAFEKRLKPEDVTQTPNYYNPADTRRLYHKLKHDSALLDEINAGFVHDKAAALAEVATMVGTKFNELWKPVQLFRLGWPFRVLMDEGARATAIFGPMYWLTGPGAESVYTAGRNVLPNIMNAAARHKRGPLGVSMGDGPVTQAYKQNPSGFIRDAEVNAAVQVPEVLWPKIDGARLEKIKGHYNRYDDWDRANMRAEANRRRTHELNINGHLDPSVENAIATGTPLTPLQHKLLDYRLGPGGMSPGPMPLDLPIFKAAMEHVDRNAEKGASAAAAEGPLVFDPARGTKHNTGYVVPLDDHAYQMGENRAQSRELANWYNDKSELLSRAGMRIVVHSDNTVTVGRHFPANRFKDAQQFAQYVSEKNPDAKLWDLGKKQYYVVQDANDLSPIAQESLRYFENKERTEFTPGKAPVEGRPSVYHGTNSTLPEDLAPRTDAPVDNGRMVGDGLYTTTSLDTAKTYGTTNLYTIRGSKSGKRYKVWDLDQPVTASQREDLEDFLRTNAERLGFSANYADDQINRIMQLAHYNQGFFATATHPSGQITWANLYENIANEAWMGQDTFHKALHQYLEEKHSVGALTHTGGTTHGHPHQVYVWMHPEDLVVKPAYAGTGEYFSLPKWFSHPQSSENLIPESQIIRKGIRNPMLRELRTIQHQIENAPYGIANETRRPLLEREGELMDALGLRLRRTVQKSVRPVETPEMNALLPNRYTVADKGHFEKMIDEARTEDEARTLRAAANGDLRAQEQAAMMPADLNFDNFDFEIDSPIGWLFNKMRERREMGSGWKKFKSADGKTTIVPSAFEGHSGQLFRGLTASNGALDVLSEGHGQGTSLFRRKAAGYKVYSPPEFTEDAINRPQSFEGRKAVRYFQVYADTVNNHLGASPIIQRMIKGQSNDSIINWLETTAEGQRVLRNVKPTEMPTGIWVDDHRFKLDHYVPSPKLQRLLGKGRLQPSDFRKNIADENLPSIYGPDLEVLDRRRGAGQMLSDLADRGWKTLGNDPIDAFSRHPFAKAMYDRKMKNLIRSTDSKWLDDEMISKYHDQAHRFAMNETRRMLYNLTETTNFNDALRFVAPFWGAQYEAISKWLRIISDRPETVGRFFAAQRAVYNNLIVVDPMNNHKEVKSGTRPGGLHGLGLYHPNDMVIMRLPKAVRDKFGLQGIGSIGIPVGSANTVLQGDLPLFPSLGPLVTIPADQFLRHVSATYGVENDQNLIYRWLFPIGRPRSKDAINQMLDQFVPGYVNRIRQANGPEDSLSRINMEMLIGREMTLRNRQLGKPDPTPEEIDKAANHLWHVREVAGIIQPFQTQFLPDHQYWIDAAHQYQKQYGNQWWDKFIDKYGEEAAIFATSSSNSVGVPPTNKGMEEWSANKSLIAKYPNWTSAIISPQAYMGQFSSDAYAQQYNINLGPGNTTALRSGSSLQERLYDDPQVQLGWREYRKVNAAIEAELHAKGLTSIEQSGAEQLQLLKQAAKASIAQKYPAWARAFQSQATTIQADVTELKQLAPLRMFDNRPDWQGVRQYLQLRDKATTVLDALGQSGGSRSLQAQANAPLRQWFYSQVGQLILANPAFAEFYTRYLDNDTLTMGSGF